MTPVVPLRVLSTLPRSGTHWLKSMVAHGLGVHAVEARLVGPKDLLAAIFTTPHRRLLYDHFDFAKHSPVLDPSLFPQLRLVLLYRNPIDALLSRFYRMAGRGDLEGTPMEALRRFIRTELREWVYNRIVAWIESGRCLAVRYEDLVCDTRANLRLVLRHLDVPCDQEQIEAVIAKNNFRVLSGGRDPGQVDVTSHYRRGIPGEWREALNEEDVAVVNREIGDYLDILGYDMRSVV